MPIEVRGLTYTYAAGTPVQVIALDGVSLRIDDGEFLGIIGPTGSGKSTLVQHLNGLLKPQEGAVLVDGVDIWGRGTSLKDVRRRVGLIFQYPEHQIFEETVYEDVAFGPRNLGMPASEVDRRVREAIKLVGLDEGILTRSPFELSGGQMRRVAIAGVLAMGHPTIVLDEPTAGLDPRGRDEILGHIRRLHSERGTTIILVSHNMEDVARLATRIVVMNKGKIVLDGTPREIFGKADVLHRIGLAPPEVTELMRRLRLRGKDVRMDVLTVDEAREEIVRLVRREAGAVHPSGVETRC
ncbi:MAG: energy-coupling factor transporter ATPase [Firmicutes bacterium]|jgi:energy-coupling factor transport system ATP-binding protein|nr:energy-coupling factor transporter ATPase [Bacillota bacterium]